MALILPILDCEVGEHVNKLIKKDFMPLAPMLRNGRLKNSVYYIMRNWHCGRCASCTSRGRSTCVDWRSAACVGGGHKKSSRLCPHYETYLAEKKKEVDI